MTPKRWLVIFYCLSGASCLFLCLALLLSEVSLRTFLMLAGSIIVIAGLLLHRRCRCPSCDCHLRDLRFSTDYCPYCGSHLDPE